MLPGERFRQWADATASGWSERLQTFGASLFDKASTKIMEALEPEAIEIMRTSLDRISAQEGTPEDVKRIIRSLLANEHPLPLLLLIPLAVIMFIPMVISLFQPLGRVINMAQERVFHSGRMDPETAIRANWRGLMTDTKMRDTLKDAGLDDEDIETMLDVTKFYPGPQDLILWQAREVFEPDMVTKYGLLDEVGNIQREAFYKAGMTDEQINNYWMAHWQHASWQQIVEMLHRGLITEADVREWFRLVEIPPFWRQLLIDSAYSWPTRVDVRRWWDMRTITETRLRELYSGMGYRGENLDDYVRWTKVYTDFPVMMARWRNGWITLDDIRTWLRSLAIPEERIESFIQEKVKSEQPARVEKERDLTKTDIYKGIKADRITRGQGIDLLMDLGFSADEAEILLASNIPEDEVDSVVLQRQLTKGDIIAGLRTEVITEAEARTKLGDLRYSPADVTLLLDIFQASIKPPAEPRQREASKADIVLAVKKDLITSGEGYLMLLDLGFTPAASEFILLVKAESSPFSPVTFGEFKDLTGKWRKAAGMTTQAFNDKFREAADELVRISGEITALQDKVKAEAFLFQEQDVIPDEQGQALKDLQVALNRALAEKLRLQQAYDTLVAEFRQVQA